MVSPAHLELATIVAAWHNRHPLARRITRADVLGTGVVALPFRPPEGAFATLLARLRAPWARLTRLLRRRGTSPASGGGDAPLRRAFDEDFIAPLRPRRVADFALRQGSATRPGPPEWPQRDVLPRASSSADPPALRYLRTAAIEVEDARLRVLIGAGPRAQVLGPRLWSRPRVASAAGILALLVLGAAWSLRGGAGAGHDTLAQAAAAASAPASTSAAHSAPSPKPPSASTPTTAHAATSASGVLAQAPAPAQPASAASLAQGAASSADAASAPRGPSATALAAAPAASAASSSDIRPPLSADLRAAARQESMAARAARAASAPPGAPDPDGKTYAVAAPATRTRAGSQLRLVLMDAPTKAEPGQPRVEVIQVGENWHAVIWPFNNRAAAERAREVLAGRGIPTEVIDF